LVASDSYPSACDAHPEAVVYSPIDYE